MATLEGLPLELLAWLLSYLDGKDIATASACCKRLREASQIDSVWQIRCQKEFGINRTQSSQELTSYELYSKILYQYGHILGVWQPDVASYGGLVVVQFTGERIEAIQCNPPTNPHVMRPLRMRRIFTVELDKERQTSLLCHSRYSKPHPIEISQLPNNRNMFQCKCLQTEAHVHPRGKEAEFSEWLSEETDNDLHYFLYQGQELLLMKFLITTQFETAPCFTRLHLPVPNPLLFEIIRPGIFKGSYGCHGVELLSLSYSEDHKTIVIRKISGDPNVPSGEVSIKVDLGRPMILTEVQQSSIQTLNEIDIPDMPEDTTLDRLPTQPFRVPSDCHDRNSQPPGTCIARFHSQGHIAGQGYHNPSFIAGHFVVFDENTFGHFWLDLHSFSLFSRITEDVTQLLDIETHCPQQLTSENNGDNSNNT